MHFQYNRADITKRMARIRVPSLLFFVFLWFGYAEGQFFDGNFQQQQFATPSQLDRNGQQLSPQQQGQILSDVQQHQHRFGLHQRGNAGVQQPQLFNRNQQILAQSGLFGQQLQQQFINQAQGLFVQPKASQEQQQQQQPNPAIFQQPIASTAQQTLTSTQQQLISPSAQAQLSSFSTPTNPSVNFIQNFLPQGAQQTLSQPEVQKNSVVFPSIAPSVGTLSGDVVQHHTQTSFTPRFINQVTQRNQFINTRPTADPIEIINEQIRQLDPETHKQRIKELQDKKAIIEKHNQFVEKQYEKALKKAQQEHKEFSEAQKEERKRLYQKLVKSAGSENIYRYSQSLPRYIFPEEAPLFDKALKQYYREHPTTTTTTTTTTPKPTTATKITANKKSYQKPAFLPTIAPNTIASPRIKSIQSLDDLDTLKNQYKSQQINKDDLLAQLRAAIGATVQETPKNLSSREISLANGKKVQLIEQFDPKLIPKGKEEEITLPNGEKVIAIRADPNLLARSSQPASQGDEITLPNGQKVRVIKTTRGSKDLAGLSGEEITLPDGQKAEIFKTSSSSAAPTYKAQEITLPNGQKVEVIKTSDPKLVPGGVALEPGSDLEKLVLAKTTTAGPPKASFEELAKNHVPPGTEFELLKTGASGGLENIGNKLPNQKKVTFVLLEEQSDGSLKVQGVKGNGKEKPDVDLDSILKKIKAGEIKLPSTTTTTISPRVTVSSTTVTPLTSTERLSTTSKPISVTVTPNSFASNEQDYIRAPAKPSSTLSTPEDPASFPILSTNIGTQFLSSSLPTSSAYTTAGDIYSSTANSIEENTPIKTTRTAFPTIRDQSKQESTLSTSNHNAILSQPKPTISTPYTAEQTPVTEYVVKSHSKQNEDKDSLQELTAVLKANGLYAMARFLKQSGLDSVLNDTGPYTVFAPTDKAFRTLLVQLGGPERAEEKFKENPRLLSGLLLHHVIPGAFTISDLQDEMTGVSLAGTQLRVNQYNMHDNEWNDVKLTTINGARVMEEHQDVPIPQGIAHAVDRVMFPLPVGDLVQTMQADRERRFTSFLRAVFASGLAEMLQGPKSLTLFAPTDKAFVSLSPEDLTRTVTDPALAKELVLRHLIQGALYTNGMRYYQVKDSLQSDAQLTMSKHSGKIKVNNQHLSTPNIPATNGVIHAIDALL